MLCRVRKHFGFNCVFTVKIKQTGTNIVRFNIIIPLMDLTSLLRLKEKHLFLHVNVITAQQSQLVTANRKQMDYFILYSQ